jgi:hypothetical protein
MALVPLPRSWSIRWGVAARLGEPRRSLCDAVSAENDGSEASCNDGKKRRGCCDVFHGATPRAVNGSRTPSQRRNSQARLRRRAQSRSRERQRGRHVSIYKPLTVIRCLPRLARCHWGTAHPRKRRADFGVKSPTRRPTPLEHSANRHRRYSASAASPDCLGNGPRISLDRRDERPPKSQRRDRRLEIQPSGQHLRPFRR